ncbi:facilitated trehalose transporter Tret1-like [Spodoptera frugiperda]|uniref:Facilitated trehalose transporter Tret1-like n=1 Tax=Spodoptera frugiperda TaxID=7108 RepID=A0A9R0DI25_SPOFR|nr:facilitated trehalose transporter Tret1-like [Spodoptera frugiperda]
MVFSPFVKQMFVATTTQLVAVSMGASLGYPVVLIQQFQSYETNIKTDLDTITWIASMHGVAGIGATLMPTLMQWKGRKYTFIGSTLLLLLGWLLAFVAQDTLTVLLSAIFHGLSSNCITIVNLVTVSEMLAPRYRSASMVLLNINQTIGQVIVAALGSIFNWQIVALIMCGPAVVALLMSFLWPESPSWLAFKGRFEESEKAFVWLRGSNDDANKELKAMLAAQKESRVKVSKKTKLQEAWTAMKRRDFYIPSLYMFLILLNFYISGALPLFIYSKDILEMATGASEIAVFGYLVMVSTLFIGSLISLILIRYFKTKTVLSCCVGCILSLFSCSLVSYLQSNGIVRRDSYLFLYPYLGYMVFNNSGFNPITFALPIDLMPVKHRGMGGALFNVLTCLLYVVTVKPFLYIVASFSLSGTLFFFATSCLLCTVLIWIYVPETKGRTLQEIEDYYNYGSFDRFRFTDDVEVKMPIVKGDVVE